MSALPARVLSEFPTLEEPSADDTATVRGQIGRTPRGDLLIAARCPRGRPAVIMTLPFEGDEQGALPPLLWLTCPWLCLQTSRLESAGAIDRVRAAIESGAGSETFERQELEFSRVLAELARWRGGRAAERTGRRGAAGGKPGSVKCLHAHVAYRLASGQGVIGDICFEEIGETGGRWCETAPDVCVH